MMPDFSPKILIRADTLAQRYNVRPSLLLNIIDPHAAWCVDEASAIAGNLHEKQQAEDDELVLTGVDGKRVDIREEMKPIPKGQGSIRHIPGAGLVLSGSFPVQWPKEDNTP